MKSLQHLLIALMHPDVSLKRAEIIGRNMWQRGLRIQGHANRVSSEEAAARDKHAASMKKASKRKLRVRGATVKNRLRVFRKRGAG